MTLPAWGLFAMVDRGTAKLPDRGAGPPPRDPGEVPDGGSGPEGSGEPQARYANGVIPAA